MYTWQLLFTFIELFSSFLMQQLEADNGYPKDFEVISAKVKDKKYTSVVSACRKNSDYLKDESWIMFEFPPVMN